MRKPTSNQILRSILSHDDMSLLRTRRSYLQLGRSRQWIDQRMRCASSRRELASEWFRRGVADGEHYRVLTNTLMTEAFGMDVEGLRRYKGLSGTNENLRDHMTDLELALVNLAETTAITLHRSHGSNGFEALQTDVKAAGKIVSQTRREIEVVQN
jgi:hypothetical protein